MAIQDHTPPPPSLLLRLVGFAFGLGPIFFGIGFLAPLIAAILQHFGVPALLGLSFIQCGLIAGILLGLIARQRRTWLW